MVVKVPWADVSVPFGDSVSQVQIPVGGFPLVDFLQQCRSHSHNWSRERARITFPPSFVAGSHLSAIRKTIIQMILLVSAKPTVATTFINNHNSQMYYVEVQLVQSSYIDI